MTPADYCDAMARWWRDASAGDAPVATRAVRAEAHAAYADCATAPGPQPGITLATLGEHHAAAWDRAAARLRGAK